MDNPLDGLSISPTNPIIIGAGIGCLCCCCIVCIVCIICRYRTQHSPRAHSSHRHRSDSEQFAIETMKHNKELVLTWIKHELGLEEYYALFIENGYGSMRAIQSIKDRSELADLGIVKKGHQTLIISNIKHMQNMEIAEKAKEKEEKMDVSHNIDERKAFNESLVLEWLESSCNLPQYLSLFISNGYDSMKIIKRIRIESQLADIGIHKVGHQVLILSEIRKLQNRRKTIDVHVDQVYIKINKAQQRPQYNPPYGQQQYYRNTDNTHYMNTGEPQHYKVDTLPNLPNTLPKRPRMNTDTPGDGDVDSIFGTMPTATTATSMGTTIGASLGKVKQELIDGHHYNVTNKGTDSFTQGFNTECGYSM